MSLWVLTSERQRITQLLSVPTAGSCSIVRCHRTKPNSAALIAELQRHGRLLFVVNQPATIGALPLAVARDEGVLVAYLPGLAMRRIADLHPGEAKTDARDAAIIAEAARSMPHVLRAALRRRGALAELAMLCGFDDDLAAQINQISNRIRGLFTEIHPALERAVGPRLQHPAILDILNARWGSRSLLVRLTCSSASGDHGLCRRVCSI